MNSQYAQAQFIARRRQQAQQRAQIFQALMSEDTPMNAIMDERLPLSDQERQNIWNQRAANQQSQRQASLRGGYIPSGTDDPAIAKLIGGATIGGQPIRGSDDQIRASMAQLARQPEWQTLDEKSRQAVLQHTYGTDKAEQYQTALADEKANNVLRRQTERTLAMEDLQNKNRYANTEKEMFHKNILERNWVIRPEGVFEKNPAYNPSNPVNDAPQYVPLGPAGEATIGKYWNDVMPGRPNPLKPEKLAMMKLADAYPDMSQEDLVKNARAQVASMQPGFEDRQARANLQGYVNNIPLTPPAVVPPAAPRMGEQVNNFVSSFGHNMGRDLSHLLPSIQARVSNLAEAPLQVAGTVSQFYNDVMGTGKTVDQLPPATPTQPTETSSYQAYPDWLKGLYNSPQF